MEDKSYRARLVPEQMVRGMAQSRHFWIDLCGFEVVYQREAEGVVFLDRDGAHFMLEESRSYGMAEQRQRRKLFLLS